MVKERTAAGKSVMDYVMIVCFGVLVFFMGTILLRFATRQVLVKMLHWDNAFTRIVFMGSEAMEAIPDDETDGATVQIDWATRYPFETRQTGNSREVNMPAQAQSLENRINSVETKITAYAGDLLFGRFAMLNTAQTYNSAIGCAEMPINDTADGVTFLKNGYLTYGSTELTTPEDIEEIADSIADFQAFLEEQNIPLVYANGGSKIDPEDTQLPKGTVEYTNANGDNLMNALAERNVPTIDYRAYTHRDFSDWYSTYYKTDHHWTNETQLWAAGVLADYLNENCGFDFDLQYFDKSAYKIETYEDYFLGGQGRSVPTLVEREPFKKITPKFETNFHIQMPTKGIDLQGDYSHTLFDEKFFDSIADYTENDYVTKKDAYSSVRWTNGVALAEIENKLPTDNEGKKLLLLSDSFGMFYATYLAADLPKLDIINLQTFDGSLQTYIKETTPNAVVILLCEKNITSVDWTTHKDYYDFR